MRVEEEERGGMREGRVRQSGWNDGLLIRMIEFLPIREIGRELDGLKLKFVLRIGEERMDMSTARCHTRRVFASKFRI